MKRIIGLLFVILVSFFTSIAGAQSSPTNPLSVEDATKLKEQLTGLSQAMGNPVPTPPTSSSAAPATIAPIPPKTMANVADKALDMVGNAVVTLSTSLSKIAPQVWRIMIKQQYAKAVDNIAAPFLLFVSTLTFMIIMRKIWPPHLSDAIKAELPEQSRYGIDQRDAEIWQYVFRSVLPTILLIVFGVIFCFSISESAKLIINPEYYAVKDILMLITNPSQMP